MTITLLNTADEIIMRWEHDNDPYAGNRRLILMADTLFAPGAAPLRRKTYACSVQLAETGKPIAHHIPASTATIYCDDPGKYTARYRVEHLTWKPIELFIPEGEGQTKFGDFTDYEHQRFKFEWSHPPIGWTSEAGTIYLRCLEESPFPNDDDKGFAFCRALSRTHRLWDWYTIHICGRNLSYARLVRATPVVTSAPKIAKKRGVRQ